MIEVVSLSQILSLNNRLGKEVTKLWNMDEDSSYDILVISKI